METGLQFRGSPGLSDYDVHAEYNLTRQRHKNRGVHVYAATLAVPHVYIIGINYLDFERAVHKPQFLRRLRSRLTRSL